MPSLLLVQFIRSNQLSVLCSLGASGGAVVFCAEWREIGLSQISKVVALKH